jgi:hypothetical protein
MDVYQKQKSQDPLLPQDNALFLGTINISGGLDFGSQRIPSSNYVVSNLYVTEEQQVFDFDLGIPHYPLTYALHEVVDFKLDGTFRSQDNSIERIVRCLLGAADFRLGAHYDGRLFEDIISQLSF